MNNLSESARSIIRKVDDELGPWWGAVVAHAIADAERPLDAIRALNFCAEQIIQRESALNREVDNV